MGTERLLTVEEFERIAPLLDGPSELVDGRLRLLQPYSYVHGLLCGRIGAALGRYLDDHSWLGEAVGTGTGFRIDDPQRPVMAPDAAFIRAARLPGESTGKDDPRAHFMDGPPDLAVEVRSPDDSRPEMLVKARRWLAVGAQEVWLIDGQHESAQVLRPDSQPLQLGKGDMLTSPDLLPGFVLPLADLFARRRAARNQS